MHRIVKVVSFPSDFGTSQARGRILELPKGDPILLEDEDGNISRLPTVSCANPLTVGSWYRMNLISAAGFPRYGFVYLEERNAPSSAISVKLRKVKHLVTVTEQPNEGNGDEFTVTLHDGSKRRIHIVRVPQYIRVGAKAILTVNVAGANETCESLQLPRGTRSRFPRKRGTLKTTSGQVKVFNGYRWISVQQAADEDLIDLSQVGHLVKSARICKGAIGGLGEYEIIVHLWKIGVEYLLDERENGGSFEVVTSLRDANKRIREMRRGEMT